ncbi:restriction endonuclease [Micromonospora sp. DT228]|uniref:restriction endonuclease n=1 Tax=Micromonospora sp. DT228 TaxID=3393443 RepID=UPI003CF1BF88
MKSGDFERLLHDLLRLLPGYQNVQLLMKENAADRGRDISTERVITDGSGSVRTERVMVQAKHWLSKSVPPEEISSTVTRIALWAPPVVRGLIVATTGHFTPDAVAWTEKHNDAGKLPFIDLWAESKLATLLSERPALAAQYGLR